MPDPKAGESKKDYISRFMSSEESQSDFPDEKQRLAVAYSMYEKRNSTLPYGKEHPWPKKYSASFIEPGVVFYQDLGECSVCGSERKCGVDGAECQTEGATVLVKQDCLAKMAQSFVGRPVIDKTHEDVTPSTVADGEANGIVTRVWLDEKSGWWMCDFLVWSPEAQQHCESSAYSVSCAYEPTEVDSTGGEYHNIPYAEDIKNGTYTHLALVTNPRYEGARIFVNAKSKGGIGMSWKFWEKGSRKNASPIDPSTEKVNVGGEEVTLQNLYDALPADEKEKFNDDTVLSTPKGEKTLGELKKNYLDKKEAEKKNAESKCETCGQPKPKENAEAGHSEHREVDGKGEEKKLPDLRVENDAAEEAAKKLDAETKEKAALELQQEKDAKAARDEKDAAEAAAVKNAADEKAKEDEKKNAEAKKDEELKNSVKREAGKKSFAALRNAREELSGDAVKINPVSIDDRLSRGRVKYGSA